MANSISNQRIINDTPAADEYGVVVRLVGGSGPSGDVTIVNPLGQQVMADSVSVVIASDQTPIPVTFTPGGTQDTNLIEVGGVAVTLGQKASAASIPVVIASDQSAIPVSGTVSVNEPVTVDAVDLDIRNLVFATDKVDVSGSTGVGVTGPLTDAQLRAVPVPVSATDLDIRNLVFATDKVDVSGSTLGANSGVDIGDVTVNNAGGGAAVNIQDGGNTITVDGTVTATPSGTQDTNITQIGSAAVVAHDSPISTAVPLTTAGVAQNMDDTAPPNRVSAENDVARVAVDLDGVLFVHPHGIQRWQYHENSSSQLTDTEVHASPGSGLSLYVCTIILSTGAATAWNAFFEEGASTVLGPYYLEAVNGRGAVLSFNPPKKITAATALTVSTSAAIAHSIDVLGYTAPG